MTTDPAGALANRGYSDRAGLGRLLSESGSPLSIDDLLSWIDGIAAAPEGWNPTAWQELFDPPLLPELCERVQAMVDDRRRQRTDSPLEPRAVQIAAVREALKRYRLSGFVVPRGDEHQGEYVAGSSERLRWLSGFTGSAGTAVVLADAAALFVDGRYTLQAGQETDSQLFEVRHSTLQPMDEWLTGRLGKKARIGYDPWLHTPNQVAALERACRRAGARAVPVEPNLIDAVWHDRPPPPIAPVRIHSDALAGETAASKRARIGDMLQRDAHNAVVLSAPDSIAWLLNIRGGDVPFAPVVLAFAILHDDGRTALFVDPRKLTRSLRQYLSAEAAMAPPEEFGLALDRLAAAGHTVRVDPDSSPQWVAARLRRGGARVVSAADPCLLPKACKNATEQSGLRAAHRRDGVALSRFLAWLASLTDAGTVTEYDAAQALERFRRQDPWYRGPSFPTISAAADNGAVVHYRVSPATNRPLLPGSLYLVDSGGQYPDGTTDVTRTVAIGQPSPAMRKHFTLVLKGHIALARTLFPKGTTGSQLDAFARRALWAHGLDYDHGTGHGVGCFLNVHEGPQRISKLPNATALAAGMVVSNEPGYYRSGAYGIRIENLLLVVAVAQPDGADVDLLGFETLTLAPIDRSLIVPEMLTAGEVAWLDGYHRHVATMLGPLVDEETAAWLADVTRPIASPM